MPAEPYIKDGDKKIDAPIHLPILSSPQGIVLSDLAAIDQAVAAGTSLALAVQLYASPGAVTELHKQKRV